MPRKKIPHFRFYPTDFLDGTHSMSASEVGDYVRILAWLYDQDGRVAYNPQALRFLLRCVRSIDADKRVRRLIDLGKLSIDADGFLHNGRVDKELQKRHDWQEKHPKIYRETPPQTPGVSASKPLSTSPKKQTKPTKAGTPARASPMPDTSLNRDVGGAERRHTRAGARAPPDLSAKFAEEARKLERQENGQIIDGEYWHLETSNGSAEATCAGVIGETTSAKPH